jgi:hypothetical protein
MANAGMSGFVSFLDAPEPGPVAAIPAGTPTPTATTAEPDTVLETVTVKQPTTVQERKIYTVQQRTAVQQNIPVEQNTSVQQSNSVQNNSSVEHSYTVQAYTIHETRRSRVKRAHVVEDGHSLAEQEIYRTLWKVGSPEGDDPEANRIVRIGYDRLAALVRLSWVTVKANLRSLEKKLAIDVLAAEDSANREGKQYRVYSNSAIWARRQSAGLLWVRRTRGVELLTDASGAAVLEPGT